MDKIVVTVTFIDEIEPGFNRHLKEGATWAFKELEERLAAKLKVRTLRVDDVSEAKP